MLVAQNSLGPVCPVPLTVRGKAEEGECYLHQWLQANEVSEVFLRLQRFDNY